MATRMTLIKHTKMYCTIKYNGAVCPVANMFDINGNELTDADTVDQVCTVVALLPDGQWLATEANYTELRPLQ